MKRGHPASKWPERSGKRSKKSFVETEPGCMQNIRRSQRLNVQTTKAPHTPEADDGTRVSIKGYQQEQVQHPPQKRPRRLGKDMTASDTTGLSRMPTLAEYENNSTAPEMFEDLETKGIDFSSAQHSDLQIRRLSNLFSGKMNFLSPDGCIVHFNTVEHFYQSERFRLASKDASLSKNEADALTKVADCIRVTIGPLKAKDLAKNEANNDLISADFQASWDGGLKLAVMRFALRHKFTQFDCFQNRDVGKQNLEALKWSGDAYLREVRKRHKDQYWGVYEGEGENMLGRLLMELRNRLLTPYCVPAISPT